VNVIKILKREERQGFQHLFTSGWYEEFLVKYVKQVVDAEIQWAGYLLKEGDIAGFSLDVAEHFIKYMGDKTLEKAGYKAIYNEQKSDVIDWYNDYRNIHNQNSALQEISNIAYSKGQLKNDLEANLQELKGIVYGND
jgi:ribonucleoside-diphosphate reductase beta chain